MSLLTSYQDTILDHTPSNHLITQQNIPKTRSPQKTKKTKKTKQKNTTKQNLVQTQHMHNLNPCIASKLPPSLYG